MQIQDFTQSGRCSGCGSCCSNYLPLTTKELKRLKSWVKKNKYAPARASALDQVLDFTCPFLDKDTTKCVCYAIRPEICRIFSCHEYEHNKPRLSKASKRYRVVNLREEIFEEEGTLPYSEASLLMRHLAQLKEGQE